MELNSYIDHTNLKAFTTLKEVKKLCEEAKKYHFASVCVNPCYIKDAKLLLKKSTVGVCTVVGFPLGANTIDTKKYEATQAIDDGADEIDMVINIGKLKDNDYDYVKKEIETIRDAINGKILKVIIETCYLDKEEIKKMTEICNDTFVNFIKTSTGYGDRGVNFSDIEIINANKNEILEIKASGGIRSISDVEKYINMGVGRIGTSNGVEIMNSECHCHDECEDDCECGNQCSCGDGCNCHDK